MDTLVDLTPLFRRDRRSRGLLMPLVRDYSLLPTRGFNDGLLFITCPCLAFFARAKA